MIEMTIYGRGGQGGVTLAKLIATAYFLRGKDGQAFGVYAAERSGAPVQAFVRVDDTEITNHNQVREPDHVVVIDRQLIAPRILTGHKSDGWIILNSAEPPDHYAKMFPGRNVATIDATTIAVENGLGTRTVPIVNTTILGAVARVLGLTLADLQAALNELHFAGGNLAASKSAFEQVQTKRLSGRAKPLVPPEPSSCVAGILDDVVGGFPTIHTGSWASRQPQRHQLTPPCNHGCPAGNNIQGFVQALANKDPDGALAILLETTPLPGVCGRVCPAPCMDACNRRLFDESLNIRELERYAADHGRHPDVLQPQRDQRVAAIGSGPAGLSCAYHLARLGYPVTLIEADRELGGILRTGIPSYRLPRDILDREISYIVRHGVRVITDRRVDRAELLNLSHEFAAVFVATGLQESRALSLGTLARGRVIQGIEFLDRVRRGDGSCRDQHVVVVGGGNTAMDAARSALRVGARSVHIIYRRTRAEMPAIREEVEEAEEEGIVLDELVAPLRLHQDGIGQVVLTCQRMTLGAPDESGRPRPVPLESEDAQFDLHCDRVILALGQTPDLRILPEGAEIKDNGVLLGLSGAPLFTGGDFSTNEGTVTAAVGNGRRAAWHIHRTLTGEDLFPRDAAPLAEPDVLHMHVFAHAARERGRTVTPDLRTRSFTEVRRGLADEPGHHAAVLEANRCFSCGVCNYCDRCVTYCPEGILLRDGDDSYRFDYDYCKGCGICAAQCPRGVVYMAEL